MPIGIRGILATPPGYVLALVFAFAGAISLEFCAMFLSGAGVLPSRWNGNFQLLLMGGPPLLFGALLARAPWLAGRTGLRVAANMALGLVMFAAFLYLYGRFASAAADAGARAQEHRTSKARP